MKQKNRKVNIQDWNLTSYLNYMLGDFLQSKIFNTLYHSVMGSRISGCAYVQIKEIFLPIRRSGYNSKNVRAVAKSFSCTNKPNLFTGACPKSCKSRQNRGSYELNETTYFKGAFFQVPPLKYCYRSRLF